MPQIFPKALNPIGRMIVIGLPILAASTGVAAAAFYRSSVAFSHAHHVGQLGIDCRYCHTTVERSGFANVPPTKTCMNCHQQIWQGADLLAPVRESYKKNEPIKWNRVHNLPHYVYFNHSIHVMKGVGCVYCHGRVDEHNLTTQSSTLLMEWCIACHRAPENHLRPREEVTNMTFNPEKPGLAPDGHAYPKGQKDLGLELKTKYKVRDAITLTSCSMCHR
jgi:hypothetical protein